MTPWPSFILLSVVLVIAAVTDLKTGKIFNWLTYPAILSGILVATTTGFLESGLTGAGQGVRASLLGLLAAVVPFGLIFAAGGLGGGDVKLMGAIGTIGADWLCVLDTAVYAFVAVAVIAMVIMVRQRILLQTLHRLLATAIFTAARLRARFPDDSPRLPFGLAACLGGLLAGVQHLFGVPMPCPSFAP